MKITFLLFTLLVACMFAVAVPPALAQTSGTGALSGTVTDPTGAVVPNATVTATSEAGQTRTAMTASNGSYTISLLPPGVYRVKIEAAGFKTEEVPGIIVQVTETAVVDRRLEVGSQAQTVTVEGTAVEAVQTANSTLGTLVTSKVTTDLPLSTRNYTNLLALSAGANAPVNNATSIGKGGVSTAVNGANGGNNNYQMDGVSVYGFYSFGTGVESYFGYAAAVPIPSPDTIQEFKIQTSTYDAGFGRNAGANVNVVTKSGTNDFHGTAFEFFRNTDLNANDWFRNFTGGKRLVFNQNQYGGVLGGPVKKDKIFFFGSYQGTGQKNGIAANAFSNIVEPPIPTGNRGTCPVGWTSLSQCDAAGQAFVPALGAAVCPANNPGNAFDNITTAGSITVACNGSNINPVAINFLQLKLPNGSYYIPSSGSPNAYKAGTISVPSIYTEYQGIGNMDFVINSKNTLTARFMDAPATYSFTVGQFDGIYNPGVTTRKYLDAGLKLTTVVSNNLVNEARVTYLRTISNSVNTDPLLNSQVGITGLPGSTEMAYILVNGLFQLGENWFEFQNFPGNQFIFGDQISWTHGRHTIRSGFEYTLDYNNGSVPGTQVGDPIVTSFPDFLIGRAACPRGTFGPGPGQCNASNPGTSNGSPSSNIASAGGSCQPGCTVEKADGGNLVSRFAATEMNGFVQDDIKLTSHLTVNAGLRYEYDGYASEHNGAWSGIWLSLINTQPYPGNSAATGSLAGFVIPHNFEGPVPAGVFRNSNNGITNNPPKDDFAPRVGFAWQPLASNRFVVRGGFGLFYDRPLGATLELNDLAGPPYTVPVPSSPNATLQMPLVPPATIDGTANIPGWTPRFVNYATGASSNLVSTSLDQHFTVPVTYEWNLNAQYEFVPTWVLELGYVGSHGIHLPSALGSWANGPPFNTAVLASPANPVCAGGNQANPATCVTTNTVANAALRVPYLGFSTIWNPTESDDSYKFNSLQVTVRKQLSRGLTLQAAYTWSRAFYNTFPGNPSTVPGATPYLTRYLQNPAYRPNRLVVNYSYTIPTGHHEGIVGGVISGWNVSGIWTAQSGTPVTILDPRAGTAFNPLFSAQSAGALANPQFCSGMGPSNVATSGSVDAKVRSGLTGGPGYMNKTGVFCAPPVIGSDGVATAWGNSVTNNYLLGPGQNDWDMQFGKITRVGGLREDATLQFRAEFYNTFNHPQFSNPTGTVNSGAFGRISSMSVNPRLLQFGLKYAF